MILVDFSQIVLASVHVFSSDFKKGQDTGKMKDIMRHTLLTSLLGYKREYSKVYGELVIACDGRRSWRKDVYAHYKANRKKGRDASDLDYDAVFEHLASMKTELKEYFPWPVVEHEKGEGDDVIAVLTKYTIENRTVSEGLFETEEPVLVISSDKDFCQLHDLGKVRQYSPITKKYVAKAEKDFLIEKIIRGDAGDGCPSVLCPDDWFVNPEFEGVRAKAVTKSVIERFKKGVGLDAEEMRRFERNKQLISFECIPENVSSEILNIYLTQEPSRDLNNLMNFLMKVRAKQLLERIQEFKVK